MKFAAAIGASLVIASHAACSAPDKLICKFVTTKPTIDGNMDDWDSVDGIETDLYTFGAVVYPDGAVTYKCVYDDTYIYFSFMIPGPFRFNATNSQMCPSIATMFKVGTMATFYNMGGCPDVLFDGACDAGFPAQCDEYRVDIGGHWETPGTEQGVYYKMNTTSDSGVDTSAANLADEYAVSPYCRVNDDGEGAGDEWGGAWTHTNSSSIGNEGHYHFELSRLLQTKSSQTDQQILTPGETYSFGLAYWDPFQSEEEGWTDPGHYLTGCGNDWIDLELETVDSTNTKTTGGGGTSGAQVAVVSTMLYAATAAAAWMAL